ncbi:hypothetical protein N658DRAFT_157022 [Parathielavia hyrcaniae]|uniref:Uncharacterized protein n=1 Tax=Parathielavia hyrcaniae TaxID=113614 RepID=A0AAN6Q0V2_9PEZI|nr:hypothetical protein N658DRAFT_157022 [Parathielavia hyrcaniae]
MRSSSSATLPLNRHSASRVTTTHRTTWPSRSTRNSSTTAAPSVAKPSTLAPTTTAPAVLTAPAARTERGTLQNPTLILSQGCGAAQHHTYKGLVRAQLGGPHATPPRTALALSTQHAGRAAAQLTCSGFHRAP